jgi:hypothetical protein
MPGTVVGTAPVWTAAVVTGAVSLSRAPTIYPMASHLSPPGCLSASELISHPWVCSCSPPGPGFFLPAPVSNILGCSETGLIHHPTPQPVCTASDGDIPRYSPTMRRFRPPSTSGTRTGNKGVNTLFTCLFRLTRERGTDPFIPRPMYAWRPCEIAVMCRR